MKKSKYELLLSNDLMERIDYIAKRMATSRSATVNRLLGERLEMSTPEGQIDPLFAEIERYFNKDQSTVYPFRIPDSDSMVLISKEKRGIQYDLSLYRRGGELHGEIHAYCKSDSLLMKQRSESFASIIKIIEGRYLPWQVRYGSGAGAFIRFFKLSDEGNLDLISDYIGMIDRLFKGYLTGVYSDKDLEEEYLQYMHDGLAGI